MKILIGNQGFKGKGFYIGRGKYSVFGNPFPTKRSKFERKVYSLEESLRKYREYFEKKLENDPAFKREFEKLLMVLRRNKKIELNCFCIEKEIKDLNDIDLENCKCHGEIIAWHLLKELEK